MRMMGTRNEEEEGVGGKSGESVGRGNVTGVYGGEDPGVTSKSRA